MCKFPNWEILKLANWQRNWQIPKLPKWGSMGPWWLCSCQSCAVSIAAKAEIDCLSFMLPNGSQRMSALKNVSPPSSDWCFTQTHKSPNSQDCQLSGMSLSQDWVPLVLGGSAGVRALQCQPSSVTGWHQTKSQN